MDLYSIAKKLRVNRLLISLAAPFIRVGTSGMTVDEAKRTLNAFYPCRAETALCQPPRTWAAPTCDISVIIPTYNNASLIAQTLHSVLSQETQARFEVVVVNDGSTDDTAQVLAGHADPRLRVIAQENRGLSGARNTGINVAGGEFLFFLDGDDFMLSGALEVLWQQAQEGQADFVQGGYNLVNMQGEVICPHPAVPGRVTGMSQLTGFAWGNLIRREAMARLCFPEHMYYEDSVMGQLLVPLLLRDGGKIYRVEQPVVSYRANPKGITHTAVKQPKCLDTVWVTDILRADRAKLGLTDTQEDYEHLLDMAALSCTRTAGMPRGIRSAVFAVYREWITEVGEHFSTRRQSKRILEKALRAGDERIFTLCARMN